MNNRNEIRLIEKLIRAVRSLIQLTRDLFLRSITLRQFLLDIRFRMISRNRIMNDDFDWEIYPKYYKEELKSISRKYSLILNDEMLEFIGGKLLPKHEKFMPLHPNHKVLYETVLRIDPLSVLEVGCGGGDHLYNLSVLKPDLMLAGFDRAQKQIEEACERHPELREHLFLQDITLSLTNESQSELVYSQAVLMHISEQDNRFAIALENMFNLAERYVVLVENWTQHDFYSAIKEVISKKRDWGHSKIYFMKSEIEEHSSAIIVSKVPLNEFEELDHYQHLLGKRVIQVH